MKFKDAEIVRLEQMIDFHDLEGVLKGLADICYEKAEHIESAWQDTRLAKKWAKAGKKIHSLAVSPAVKGLP